MSYLVVDIGPTLGATIGTPEGSGGEGIGVALSPQEGVLYKQSTPRQ